MVNLGIFAVNEHGWLENHHFEDVYLQAMKYASSHLDPTRISCEGTLNVFF